jgi:hypothetical protein
MNELTDEQHTKIQELCARGDEHAEDRQFADRAADELMRAYATAGPDISKDQDPKYLSFLQTRAKDIETPKAPKKAWQFWK